MENNQLPSQIPSKQGSFSLYGIVRHLLDVLDRKLTEIIFQPIFRQIFLQWKKDADFNRNNRFFKVSYIPEEDPESTTARNVRVTFTTPYKGRDHLDVNFFEFDAQCQKAHVVYQTNKKCTPQMAFYTHVMHPYMMFEAKKQAQEAKKQALLEQQQYQEEKKQAQLKQQQYQKANQQRKEERRRETQANKAERMRLEAESKTQQDELDRQQAKDQQLAILRETMHKIGAGHALPLQYADFTKIKATIDPLKETLLDESDKNHGQIIRLERAAYKGDVQTQVDNAESYYKGVTSQLDDTKKVLDELRQSIVDSLTESKKKEIEQALDEKNATLAEQQLLTLQQKELEAANRLIADLNSIPKVLQEKANKLAKSYLAQQTFLKRINKEPEKTRTSAERNTKETAEPSVTVIRSNIRTIRQMIADHRLQVVAEEKKVADERAGKTLVASSSYEQPKRYCASAQKVGDEQNPHLVNASAALERLGVVLTSSNDHDPELLKFAIFKSIGQFCESYHQCPDDYQLDRSYSREHAKTLRNVIFHAGSILNSLPGDEVKTNAGAIYRYFSETLRLLKDEGGFLKTQPHAEQMRENPLLCELLSENTLVELAHDTANYSHTKTPKNEALKSRKAIVKRLTQFQSIAADTNQDAVWMDGVDMLRADMGEHINRLQHNRSATAKKICEVLSAAMPEEIVQDRHDAAHYLHVMDSRREQQLREFTQLMSSPSVKQAIREIGTLVRSR